MTFPGLDESHVQKFEDKRKAVTSGIFSQTLKDIKMPEREKLTKKALAVKESLLQVDLLQAQAALKNSIAGRIGTSVEGLTRFAGFDWRTNIALIGGFAAKEVVVSTLGIAYSLCEVNPDDTTSLSQRLKQRTGGVL